MKTIKVTMGLILLMFALVLVPELIYAQSEIMPIEQIEVGMKGVGKTVISGTTIEEFDVEILGILKGQSVVGDLILCRVSGPLIEKAGGIAAGMSGSPVYVDGKIIGAIGYGWGMTSHRLGMITPIESMLKVMEMSKSHNPSDRIYLEFEYMKPGVSQQVPEETAVNPEKVLLTEPIIVEGELVKRLRLADSYAEAKSFSVASDTLVLYPAKTPLLVSGLTGRALERLTRDLQRFDVKPIQTGSGGSLEGLKRPLEPGSAVAAQLVRGDIDVSAIGTLTYLDYDQFIAFGHPFLKLGKVEYYLSDAEILTVVDSLDMPFKLGMAGEPRGVVKEDRNAAIAGQIGQMPSIIPVTVVVQDLDLHEQKTIEFHTVRDEELFTSLAVNAVLQAADTVMDRQGYGTAIMKMEIVGDKLPEKMISYHNMYYSSSDIAAGSLGDLYGILDTIITNPFTKVNIGSINVELKILRNHQVAIVEEVKLLNEELHPGDMAKVEVSLRPYRGELLKKIYEVKIPENMEPGDASLTISGGLYGGYEEEAMPEAETSNSSSAVAAHPKSLTAMLEDYLKLPKNNELVVEIVSYYSEPMEEEPTEEPTDSTNDNSEGKKAPSKVAATKKGKLRNAEETSNNTTPDESKAKEIFPTEYILEGTLTLEITITANETTPSETDSLGNTVNTNN